MRKIINISLIILGLLSLIHVKATAQYILKEADHQYNLYNYHSAAQLYTKAFTQKKTLYAAQRLAESYRLMRDFKLAEQWYAKVTTIKGANPLDFRHYAELLQNNGKYSEAKVQYGKYGAFAKEIDLIQLNRWQLSCDSAMQWMKNPKPISILNERTLNSAQSDWAAVGTADGLVFSSDRTTTVKANDSNKPFLKFDGNKLLNKETYGWTGNNYLRLYQKLKGLDSLSIFSLPTDPAYHVGNASMSADGKEVFFTLTRIPKLLFRTNKEPSTINVEIYSSKKENGIWSQPFAFRYNNVQQWSVGDPFLTNNGNTLYFVSNKPDGKGGTDIYYCIRNADGSWADAINLATVNTPANERTPALIEDAFYFATNGGIGMGGLDVFEAKMIGDSATDIKNMGYPINSPQDDFAYSPTSKLTGYLSSNREGGLGSDDIYRFTVKEVVPEKPIFALKGKVRSKETNQPLKNAAVSLVNANGALTKVITDTTGAFSFKLEEQSAYLLWAEKTGYIKNTINSNLTTHGLKKSAVLEKDLYLSEIVIGKAIRIANIFYDFDQSNIRPDAALELDKLVTVLNENPNIWIELGSHTDSRGNDVYNQKLSQARANAAVNYIISKGIANERITAKGYGETMLVNLCVNGSKCSNEQHQLNRRTEFKIVKQ